MSREELNGKSSCPVADNWKQFINRFNGAVTHCEELHETMELILKNTGYLLKLPQVSEELVVLNAVMKEMKDTLLASAISKEQLPIAIVEKLLARQELLQNKSTRTKDFILVSVVLVLLFILGFLLTGEKLSIINPLYHK